MPGHTHEHLLKKLALHCEQEKERLTPLRTQVFRIICDAKAPIGAYDILARLEKEHPSARPPTVYRALEFLRSVKGVHRIDHLNAYLPCHHPGMHSPCHLFICRDCESVEEICSDAITQTLLKIAQQQGFLLEQSSLEVLGVCGKCQK